MIKVVLFGICALLCFKLNSASLESYTVYRTVDRLTATESNFEMGFYLSTTKSKHGAKVDPRMFKIGFEAVDGGNSQTLKLIKCPKELSPEKVLFTRCVDSKNLVFGTSKKLILRIRACKNTDLPDGQKCFSRRKRQKYYQENGQIRLFPFY